MLWRNRHHVIKSNEKSTKLTEPGPIHIWPQTFTYSNKSTPTQGMFHPPQLLRSPVHTSLQRWNHASPEVAESVNQNKFWCVIYSFFLFQIVEFAIFCIWYSNNIYTYCLAKKDTPLIIAVNVYQPSFETSNKVVKLLTRVV